MLMVATTFLVAEMAEAAVTLLQVGMVDFLEAEAAVGLHRQQRQLAARVVLESVGFGRIR